MLYVKAVMTALMAGSLPTHPYAPHSGARKWVSAITIMEMLEK